MRATDVRKKFLKKKVLFWLGRDFHGLSDDFRRTHPTGVGIVEEVKGRNVCIAGDWHWAPYISKMDFFEQKT